MNLGEWLSERRAVLGVRTQDQLRELLARRNVRVSRTTVSNWHTGQARPSQHHFSVLLDALAVVGDEKDRACRIYALTPPVPNVGGEAVTSSAIEVTGG